MSEQKTFKYLDQANAQGGDAAQDFLNKKLSKNKYMSVSNPDNPYSMGEGTTPDGTAYPNSKASIAAASSETKSSSDSDSPIGSMSAEEVRERFGLKYDEATAAKMDNKALGMNKKGTKTRLQTDDGHFWYEDANGQQKYLGQAANYTRGSTGYGGADETGSNKSDKSNYHAGDSSKSKNGHHQSSDKLLQQVHDIRSGPGHTNGFNSVNDLGGAFRALISKEAPKVDVPTEEATPIEHSPEIREAKERVQSYEQDALTGKTSEAIFGKSEAQANDQYQFDATQGIKAFGSSPANNEAASTATQSFLDKKVFDVKKKLEPSV